MSLHLPAKKNWLMSLFLWCCLIGCSVLALSLLLDGLFDGLFDGLDGTFFDGALPVVAAAVSIFGAAGMVVEAAAGSQAPLLVGLGGPLLSGLLAGGITRTLWKRFKHAMPRNAVAPNADELVGSRVRVLWWKNGRGEVAASTRGHQLTLPAVSQEVLRSGATVVVLAATNGTLEVTALEAPAT